MSVHNPRQTEEFLGAIRRIGEGLLTGQTGVRNIRIHHIHHIQDMMKRFDAGGIDLVQLVNILKNLI